MLACVHAAATAALRQPGMVGRLAADGTDAAPSPTGELGAFMAREVENWTAVIRDRGIRPD